MHFNIFILLFSIQNLRSISRPNNKYCFPLIFQKNWFRRFINLYKTNTFSVSQFKRNVNEFSPFFAKIVIHKISYMQFKTIYILSILS